VSENQPPITTPSQIDQISDREAILEFLFHGKPIERLLAMLAVLIVAGIPTLTLTAFLVTGWFDAPESDAEQTVIPDPITHLQTLLPDNPWQTVFIEQYQGGIAECHSSLGPLADYGITNDMTYHADYLDQTVEPLRALPSSEVAIARAIATYYWVALYSEYEPAAQNTLCQGALSLLRNSSRSFLEANYYQLTQQNGDYVWLPPSNDQLAAEAQRVFDTPDFPEPQILKPGFDHLLLRMSFNSPRELANLNNIQAISLQPYTILEILRFNGLDVAELPATHQANSGFGLEPMYDQTVNLVVMLNIGSVTQPQVSAGYGLMPIQDLYQPNQERNLNEAGRPWVTVRDLEESLERSNLNSNLVLSQVIELNSLEVSLEGYVFGGEVIRVEDGLENLLPSQQLASLTNIPERQHLVAGSLVIVPR
jgi:hypothetical protein